MTKHILTDDEVATLKATRKILKRVSKKHQKLVDAAWKRKGEFDPIDIENFEDSVYRQAKIDFIEDDQAFIKL